MANAFTNLTDTVILDAAIDGFVAAITPVRAFAINCSPAPAQRGDKVKVLFVGAQDAAIDWVAANGYVMQDADAEGLDVALDKRKYVSWGIQDQDLANNPQLSLERFGRQKGFNLAKAVLQDIWSLVTLVNYGAAGHTGAGANFDSDDVADLEQVCDEADWPEFGRSIVLSPAYHNGLVKDDAVQGSLGVENSGALADSRVQRVHGFDEYKSNLIPANNEHLTGMAVIPDAILVAMRYIAPQEGHKYFQAAAVTDPNGSGLTIGFRDWYDEDSGTRKKVLECCYGYLKGNPAALKRIVSQ
jgi:hypothetical protein